jgi:hypothetical protein
MSQANVELFRQAMENVNAPRPDEALASLLAADFRIDNIVTAVTDKTYYGAAGCLEWLNEMTEAFAQGWRCEVESILADSHEFVVGGLAFMATGAHSGAPLHLRWIGVAWFRDGKVARMAGYSHRFEALKAVGLQE